MKQELTHYQEYQNGNHNIFEDIVDRMVLEQISGINPVFKKAISSLSNSEKRLAILSLLDKDRNLFLRIKALTNSSINKMDHIKDVILMLREYVKVGEVEKKKYGEVMTPLDLVKEMLATLPEDVWSNPNLKWLDPANGTGPYPIMVVYKLMNGLKEWEPDDEKRYKHIIENMIYVCELQPKNMFLYMCAVDPFDTYKLNIYTGSFLEEGFDKHMKEVWNVEKFDIVMGNPPYQETLISGRSKGGGKGGDNNLWSKFVSKSLDISEYILFIHPPSFLSPNHNILNKINEFGGLKYLKIFDKSPFENASTNACYYLYKNRYDAYTKMNDQYLRFKSGIFPNSSNPLDFSIFSKFFSISEKINFKRTCSLHSSNKKEFISKIQTDNFRYKYVYGSKIIFSSIKSEYHNLNKVIVSRSGYLNPFYDNGNISLSETNYFTEVIDESMSKSLIRVLNSKLYDYVLKKSKFSGFFHGEVIKNIPIVPFDREWTDEKLFEYFNLTEEEIKLIIK
jgi:hypothetical protein